MKTLKIKKIISSFAVAAVCVTGLWTETSYAVEGWNRSGDDWVYLDRNDEPVSGVWKDSNDHLFYLGADGYMVKDSFVETGGGLYYVGADGRRIQNDWVYYQAESGGERETGWYYFGDDGKAYYKKGSNFKKIIGGKTYGFDENGRMLTGWINREGNVLTDNSDIFTDGEYYTREDGAFIKNTWLDYGSMDVFWAEGFVSSVSGRDYQDYDQLWMYFDTDGKRFRSKNDKLCQKNLDGSTYGFDEYGIMLPWWSTVASISNADKSNPTTSEPLKFYAGYDGGRLLKNTWFWMYPSVNLIESDGVDEEYSWWRTDENGEVYQNRIKKVGEKTYAFDGLGRMLTGFVLSDGRSTFVAQYDPDTWSSEDFKQGNIYGAEKADLYLFSPDELNDGSMQTGNDIKVELEDGVFTFGFGSNGIAYGNQNKPRKVKDAFYINGLKLEADEDYGYGVVMENTNDNPVYRAVGTNGKIITGNRRIIKDRENGWLIILNGKFMARVEDESRPKWINGSEGPGYYHYDKDNKENMYAAGLITGYDSEPDPSGLPSAERLNFE